VNLFSGDLFSWGDDFTNYGRAYWDDQVVGYSFTYATTDTNLRLGFGTSLDENVLYTGEICLDNESWGIDNVLITNNSAAPAPEPATMLLFGTGLAGLVITKKRKRGRHEKA